jgi:biotin carboxylase
MAADSLARIAVLLDLDGSLTPTEIAVAADPSLPVCFLVNAAPEARPEMARLGEVAEALAPTVRADFSDVQACVDAARSYGCRWATTFADQLCSLACTLNDALGGRPCSEPLWGRKDLQRQLLRQAGISSVRSTRPASAEALLDFARDHGLPIVVKPVNGRSSRDVRILRSAEDCDGLTRSRSALAQMFSGLLFVEEFIGGQPPPAPYLADYVSAEVFRVGEDISLSFVTDRLRPASGGRETGLILPTRLPDYDRAAVLDTARDALEVLKVSDGAFHVEIKPLRPRPEIIEVNGRLGGFVARLVRYGTSADVGKAALAAAMGRSVEVEMDWRYCVMVLLFQPPPGAVAVASAPARRDVSRFPGVRAVEGLAEHGSAVDWHMGTDTAVARVWLMADDHDGLRARLAGVAEFLANKFSFVDDVGRRIRSESWLGL